MDILSFFSFSVFAAETILSPLPDTPVYVLPKLAVTQPNITFGHIAERFKTGQGEVLALDTEIPFEVTPTAETNPNRTTKKPNITIAVVGDSMIDTLGPGLPDLKQPLSQAYPNTEFTLLNYGVGATNIEYGIERITSGYTYLSTPIPAVVETKPDLIVIESFGYNPFPESGDQLNRHWLALSKAIDNINSTLPGIPVVIAVTIAPNSTVFCDGAPGIAFSPEEKVARTTIIKSYLDNAVRFAEGEHLPLADAYHPSLVNGNGNIRYINPGDHIHYSNEGRVFFSHILAEAIIRQKLLE